MTEDVTITKEVNVDFVVDFVRCRECGQHLNFDVDIDGNQDLEITVDKCDCEK